ncbi:hypothetical protein NX02_25740 [Sphingomonas sanxanigenens DSM 19645 = NX02]|uniref:Uncharacterized protein n=2 Tax=Sphingomonas sanxanigenens TaxID=397260 RepID=W0AKC1_9SPHN|nr:hypothetical protein NX02_25740 [Sphingomonas sanxanigenens DSM 19645 = NX02]
MAAAMLLLSPMLALSPAAAVAQAPAPGSEEDFLKSVREFAEITAPNALANDQQGDKVVFLRQRTGETTKVVGISVVAAGTFLPSKLVDSIANGPTAVLRIRDRRDHWQKVKLDDYPSVEEPHNLRIFVASGTLPDQKVWEIAARPGFEMREIGEDGVPGEWNAWQPR